MAGTVYGDISPRTAAYVVKDLLERGMPHLVFEKFGQSKPLPQNSTQQMTFRRYFLQHSHSGNFESGVYFGSSLFDPTSAELTEAVTPDATQLDSEDITISLKQYGTRVRMSDVIQDTHEDPVLQEATDIVGETAATILEKVRFNKLIGGTNVYFANGSARGDVNSTVGLSLQRKITRQLKRNLGKPITKVLKSTPAYGTESVAPSYVAIAHTDLENDIRDMQGFVPVEKYGSMTPYEGEIGKVEDVRYIVTTICEAWEDAGGDRATNGVISTGGTSANVYPILYLARDAYGIVPLKGKSSITPMVVNPTPSDSDPLGQRAHVSWKAWQGAVILNDQWLVRAEVAASD